MHGLELLKKGLIWRIGNGENVQIWRDNWIPRNSSLKVSGARRRGRFRWVSQLMCSVTREWDMGMVKHIFHAHDAEEILKIRLSERSSEDLLAWHYEKIGMYSVRSGYRLAMQEVLMDANWASPSSSRDGERKLWVNVWAAPVPEKIKIFAWRLASNGLATMQNKKNRRMEVDGTCRLCGVEKETGFYAVAS
ncbi:hypothetical protein C2845_PM03G01330 [Panicum miliaceum]|uniref:Reverse transcriptase zinc-binding domain-containing protein n=1 Tax=Panicum miliaceum TaxID=4540 RepID=A0A3L6T4E4_PANMI|nr:hypothetical protein C2845_PM03G01330 [Panicum miliaceum]